MEDLPKHQTGELKLPSRPKILQQMKDVGQPIELVSNMFPIQYKGPHYIYFFIATYVYNIKIEPEIPGDARNMRERILQNVQRQLRQDFNDPKDKRAETGLTMFSFMLQENPLIYTTRKIKGKIYTVTYTNVNKFSVEEMEDNDQGNALSMIMNSYVRDILKSMNYIEIGKNGKYYDPTKKNQSQVQAEDCSLYIWSGYKTSVHMGPEQQYLQIDTATRLLRSETARDFILKRLYGPYPKGKAEAEIKGKSVMANYGNQAMYQIHGVDWNKNPMSTFQKYTGETITFQQYFLENYGTQIQDLKQPLLLHSNKKLKRDIYLIPELMLMTGLEDREKSNRELMKNISKYTRLTPYQRMMEIDLLSQRFSDVTQIFQFKENNLPSCAGLVLNPPAITFADNQNLSINRGDFNMKQNQVIEGKVFNDWAIVYGYQGYEAREQQRVDAYVEDIVKDMQKIAKAFNITINNPGYLSVKSQNPDEFIDEIQKDIDKHGYPQFIVTLIEPKFKRKSYQCLKSYFYKILQANGVKGIPHQNIITTSLQKNRMSVLSNIVLQMNAKIGGILWQVQKPIQIPKRLMLIGIDIYHKKIKKNSCVGVVATMNQDLNQFYSRVVLVPQGKQLVHELNQIIKNSILKYYSLNKTLPTDIIIYRDGVSESQTKLVLNAEVKTLFQTYEKMVPGHIYNPKTAYILVNKKVNHKFFTKNNDDYNNCPSGTIIHEEVVSRKNFDFFLTAQNVESRQGTCTPTHYRVIYDDTGLPQDFFWQLTFYQCFNYYNWMGAIRVPACVMYAKKLAYLVGETFQDEMYENLCSSLCFL